MATNGQRRTGSAKGRGGAFRSGANPFARHPDAKLGAAIAAVRDAASTLDSVLSHGFAVIFGRTRDGGALSITLLDGDERHRTYCANQDELDEAFDSLLSLVVVERDDGTLFEAPMPKLRKDL